MNLTEMMLKKNYVYNGKIFKVRNDDVLASDGAPCFREFIEHSGGVGILPVTDDEKVILVKQYRYPYGECVLEIPAGKKDINESPLDCAIRELKEETGYISKKIEPLGEIYPSPGYTNEKIYIYTASELIFDGQKLDDGEFLEVYKYDINEAVDMVNQNIIKDAKTIIAILKYQSKNIK